MRFAHIADAFLGAWARKPATWVVLGSLAAIAVLGVFLASRGESPAASLPASAGPSATPTATRTPFAALIPSASPSASTTPASSSTAAISGSSQPANTSTPAPSSTPTTAPPTATQPPAPTPTPTTPPVVAGGPYCDTLNAFSPPTRVLGTITIGGAPAPAGVIVSLTFDGVAGPSRAVAEPGGYYVDFWAGSASCANRPGATVRVVVNGVTLATGFVVGEDEGFLRFDITL